jgi:hypothetical protein
MFRRSLSEERWMNLVLLIFDYSVLQYFGFFLAVKERKRPIK